MYVMSEKYARLRLTLSSVHNIVDYASTSLSGLCSDIIQRYDGWRLRCAGRLSWSAFDGSIELSFHFAFHAISGLQIHKHQLRGDQQNYQRD